MSDNVELNAGTGGATLATDDVGGVQFQKVKLDVGGDGATAALSNSNPLPVSDAGGSLTVDGTVELGATSLAALESLTTITTVTTVGAVTAITNALPVGANTIGAVNLAQYTPSSGRLPIELDAAALAALETITVASVTAPLAAGSNVIGGVTQSGTWNVTNVSGTVSLPTGAATAAKQPALGTAGAASADVITIQGIASMTKLLVTPDSVALPANQSVNNSQINGVTPLMGNGVTGTGSQRVTIASDNTAFSVNATLQASTNTQEVVGDAAHDAAIAGNPVRIAARAMTADYTSVASGDTADLLCTLNGKQVVQPYAIPELTWSYAAASGGIVNTTGVTAKAAAAAGIRNYIVSMDVVNGHATVDTDVQIRDGASGTVLWRGFAKAAGGGVSRKFDPPLKGTAATLVEVACGTTGTATYFNLAGYTGP